MKKTLLPAMLSLSLFGFGLTVSFPSHADTLSDLKSQCLSCHNVIVLPSGWSLDGSTSGIGRTGDHDLAGWNATVDAMGSGKCGFSAVGPGGTPRSVAAQYLFDRRSTVTLPPTATFTPTPTSSTPTPTFTPTPTASPAPNTLSDLKSQCLGCHNVIVLPSGWSLDGSTVGRMGDHDLAGWNTTIAAMGDGKCGFATVGPGGTARSVAAQYLYDKRMTIPPSPSFTSTFTPNFSVTPTFTFTPTASPTVSPTPTTSAHTWYDYDYLGGRCFQKDHTIVDKLWCEQHGLKGGGSHPSLTGYQRHAHLDSPGQKP